MANRFRFVDDVLARLTTVWGPGRVGIRINPNGRDNGVGSPDNFEVFSYVAKRLNAFNLSYLHMVDGLGDEDLFTKLFTNLSKPLTLADIRPLFEGTLVGNGLYDQYTDHKRICAGEVDAISFGQKLIDNSPPFSD